MRGFGFAGQLHQLLDEGWILIEEQAVCDEGLYCRYRTSIDRQGRADDRDRRKVRAEELARLGLDQVSLEHLAAGLLIRGGELVVVLVGGVVEIEECQASDGIAERSQRLSERVAHLVVPEREMINLDSADAQENSQNFGIVSLESQSRIEAGAALFDVGEMDTCDVCDGLNGRTSRAEILQGNGRLLDDVDQLRELGSQVGILRAAI